MHGLEVGEAQRPVETVAVAAHESHRGEVPAEILAGTQLNSSVNQKIAVHQRQHNPSIGTYFVFGTRRLLVHDGGDVLSA